MAERRMFAKTIIDSDAFLDMPLSAQALYFHLSMRADDDGFINNPRKIQRMTGAGDDDFKLLLAKRFLIIFESGVVVIKHWKIHNYIRNDRYKPTVYQKELKMLSEKENKSYTLGIPTGYQTDTQVRLGKERLVKDSLVEDSRGEPDTKKEEENSDSDSEEDYFHKLKYFNRNVILSEDQVADLLEQMGLEVFDYYIAKLSTFIDEKGARVSNHYKTILKWWKEDSVVGVR